MIKITVINNDIGRAMREIKKQGQKGGLFKEAKLRKYRLKPSEEKARDAAERKKRMLKQKSKAKF